MACMNFFSFNFPLREFFFLYFARPSHKFSNGPSLKPLTSGLLVQRSLKVTLVLVSIVSSFTPVKEMNVRDLFARSGL